MPVFFLLLLLNKELLVVDHFYIMMVIFVMTIPSAVALYFHSYLWKRILPLTPAFIVFFLLYEYSALKTGQWIFLEGYIGWIRLFDVKFPVEELLFGILSVPGTIALYEFFSGGGSKQSSSFLSTTRIEYLKPASRKVSEHPYKG